MQMHNKMESENFLLIMSKIGFRKFVANSQNEIQ